MSFSQDQFLLCHTPDLSDLIQELGQGEEDVLNTTCLCLFGAHFVLRDAYGQAGARNRRLKPGLRDVHSPGPALP